MSVRFVACVTRYSRGAKNRYGLEYNTCFITIFLRCIIAKIIQIGPGSTKLLEKLKGCSFFLKHSVDGLSEMEKDFRAI